MTTPADVLRQARRRDSTTKRARVLASLTELETAGEPITFALLARHARVSTWLVYADGIREHVHAAQARQQRPPDPAVHAGTAVSAAGLRTDLELARQELHALRRERDQLREALRRRLGEDLDALGRADLTARVDELTTRNRDLETEHARLQADNQHLREHAALLDTELAAARTSLRRMIRHQNREPS
jgi:hypothetical protein